MKDNEFEYKPIRAEKTKMSFNTEQDFKVDLIKDRKTNRRKEELKGTIAQIVGTIIFITIIGYIISIA